MYAETERLAREPGDAAAGAPRAAAAAGRPPTAQRLRTTRSAASGTDRAPAGPASRSPGRSGTRSTWSAAHGRRHPADLAAGGEHAHLGAVAHQPTQRRGQTEPAQHGTRGRGHRPTQPGDGLQGGDRDEGVAAALVVEQDEVRPDLAHRARTDEHGPASSTSGGPTCARSRSTSVTERRSIRTRSATSASSAARCSPVELRLEVGEQGVPAHAGDPSRGARSQRHQDAPSTLDNVKLHQTCSLRHHERTRHAHRPRRLRAAALSAVVVLAPAGAAAVAVGLAPGAGAAALATTDPAGVLLAPRGLGLAAVLAWATAAAAAGVGEAWTRGPVDGAGRARVRRPRRRPAPHRRPGRRTGARAAPAWCPPASPRWSWRP